MTQNQNITIPFLLTIISCLATSIVQAASLPSRSLPGYYIEKNGDTIFCKIDFNDLIRNPTSVTVEVKDEKKTFGPGDIAGFGVTGYDDYRSMTVSYHPGPILGTDLPSQYSDKIETRSCFLRVLVKGPYALYELKTQERFFYFIGQPDNTVTELIYRAKLVDQVVEEDQQFKTLLANLFKQEGIAEANTNLVYSAGYYPHDIRNLVEKLNQHRTGKITLKPKAKLLVQADIFAGGIDQTFPTEFKGQYTANNRFAATFNPIGGINFCLVLPGHFQSFAIGLSIGYYSFSSSIDKSGSAEEYQSANYHFTSTYNEHMSFARSQIQTNLYAMYIFNKFGKVRPYVKVGVYENFSMSNNNDITYAYTSSSTGIRNGVIPISWSGQGAGAVLSTKDFYVALNIAAGLMIRRQKFELVADYPQPDISADVSRPFRIASFGFCYYYTLLK
ncbi:hypothetical protein [Puia dinghuensis]|uniref:Outer membrane protein beta-barrel domain-containing protein n=1 Tax=Puia dinghuensis TaxID=1792502 RepID=A0A8J2UJR8_9BACT|nr:hypothetical protein [Puia dinghuensis]GGB25372.1 hypothetical protein GCM10011511_56630 [Puia dinghuensis]